MAKKVKNRITAWSYSRYSTWIKCAFMLKCNAILRIKQPSNYFMERGTDIHNKGEQYLLGNIRGIPPEYKMFGDEMKMIKGMGALPEVDLAVAKGWKPSAGDDWNNVWCRAKVDADIPHEDETESTLIDYKTGRYYPSHDEQGELYSICKFSHAKEVKIVDVEFWYLDSGDVKDFQYKRKDLAKLKKKWENRTKPMLTDTTFKPNPGQQCRKCFYSSKNGSGPCKY